MQQKICVSKKITLLVGIGIIFLLAAVAFNNLTQQKTSTNTRAADISMRPSSFPNSIRRPTCNTYGEVIVKDSNTGKLWSWASKSVATSVNGPKSRSLPCISEPILVENSTPIITPIIFPREAAQNKYVEFFKKESDICYSYGLSLSLTENRQITEERDLKTIPQALVKSTRATNLCENLSINYCKKEYQWINGSCWFLGVAIGKDVGGIKKCESSDLSGQVLSRGDCLTLNKIKQLRRSL